MGELAMPPVEELAKLEVAPVEESVPHWSH